MPTTIQTSKLQVRDKNGTYVNIDAVSDATTAERITLINQAGTTNVNSVNSAGAAQVQAVAAKAAEVTSQLATSEEMEDMVAEIFNTTTAYSAGTYVIQTINGINKLYRFNIDHAAGAWNGTDASQVKMGAEVAGLKREISTFDVFTALDFTLSQGGINTSNGASAGSDHALYNKRVRTGYIDINKDTGFSLSTPSGYLTQIYYYDKDDSNRYISYDAFADYVRITNPAGNRIRIAYASTSDVEITPSDLADAKVYGISFTDTSISKAGKAADAKAVGDMFAKYDLISVNRFDKNSPSNVSGVVLNKNTGNTSGGSSYGTSDYIDISDIKYLTTCYCIVLCFYDATKTFIPGGGTQYSNYDTQDYVKAVPSDAKFAKISYKLTSISDVQIGYSLSRSNYIAYDKKFSFPSLRLDADQILPEQPIIVAQSGGDYTSLTEAVYATLESGKPITVKPGTYNIVSEYIALFGQDVVDALADATDLSGFQYGIRIKNRKIVFEAGSHVVCDWTGHTVNSTHRFSVFSIADNAEVDGLDLDCTAVFYAIHDDYGSVSNPVYKIFRNCRIVGHSIVNDNVIGGGCRPYCKYIIDNCYFDNNGSATSVCVRYHNSNVAGSEPVLWITNSYFAQRLSFRWYGSQTTKMRVYVNNCYANAIYKGAEGSSTNDNVDLYKWNNEETNPVT